ncbi:hypothetical protein FRX31_028694 [Thalictrum thalictroides]|uniref:Uncharacterized protein n=1 Tax=Thalictrum thalictroides TaxID=46969 RepID=A0A7J6V9K1_THATH|nr:hypothetical protein FRX31_028694 [Thalictrum thalictroides]
MWGVFANFPTFHTPCSQTRSAPIKTYCAFVLRRRIASYSVNHGLRLVLTQVQMCNCSIFTRYEREEKRDVTTNKLFQKDVT